MRIQVAPPRCRDCSTELAPDALACPACRRLVHADALRELAASARACEERRDAAGAREAWARVLGLLPADASQRATVEAAVQRWAAEAPAAGRPPPTGPWRRLGPLAAVAYGAWKLIAVAKLAPFLALAASFALYWQAWGWAFAAGLLACIYVHELGHVLALRHAGIPASAPMFIPGVGAFVRMHRAPPDPGTNAFVGLAGPAAGLLAAAACQAVAVTCHAPLFRAVAQTGAVVNLFNLIPLWSLDGARGFAALVPWQRVAATAAAGLALLASGEKLLWLLVLVGFAASFSPRVPARPHHRALLAFAALVGSLSWLAAP